MKRDPSGSVATSAGVGTITAGDSEVEINHTLGRSPRAVLITPFGSCAAQVEVLQSSVDASKFTVRFVDGIILDDDANFSWVVI